jgi:hypothetical protein
MSAAVEADAGAAHRDNGHGDPPMTANTFCNLKKARPQGRAIRVNHDEDDSHSGRGWQ